MVWIRWFRHDLTIILGRDTPWPSPGKDNQPWQFNASVLHHHLNWKQIWLNSSSINASMNHVIFLWQIVFKQVLWNSSNLNYWSYHYRMVERMIEFLSSSAKLPCELLRWAICHYLRICDNVVATEMQVRSILWIFNLGCQKKTISNFTHAPKIQVLPCLTLLYCFFPSPIKWAINFLYSFQAVSGNMDIAPFKLDTNELIADYDKVNFVRNFVCTC